MVSQGIFTPVKDTARQNSSWASPIVIVNKPDSGIWHCIDHKRTLNPSLVEDHYPLPRIENLLVSMGGKIFYSLIDLTGAFQQLELTSEASRLVAVNMPFCLYQFTRMPFGIKAAGVGNFPKVHGRHIRGMSMGQRVHR